jgi:hypothetical protein
LRRCMFATLKWADLFMPPRLNGPDQVGHSPCAPVDIVDANTLPPHQIVMPIIAPLPLAQTIMPVPGKSLNPCSSGPSTAPLAAAGDPALLRVPYIENGDLCDDTESNSSQSEPDAYLDSDDD